MAETSSPERRVVVRRAKRRARHFIEPLSEGVGLDMVLIPGGSFLMGAPESELESEDNERPQHEVTVPPFCMGRFQVMQEQWRIVAGWELVERELELEPASSKGDRRPVEQVSWDDATEFCQRLSRQTERTYRLPSEAEWEYACRAGTRTPFHFGETLDATLANYRAKDKTIGGTLYKGAYGRGVEGEYQRETTKVGSFPANAFWLHDMHGNVWEWCEDDWHGNYADASSDGKPWLEGDSGNTKLLRGGSWISDPGVCRSARRYDFMRDGRFNFIGFRVCCEPPRTPALGT